ncbi:MAG: YfhO family protein [Ruminococcus sp.]|nr:YfhO family protein [Ruminococcus sp.]
MKKEQTYRQILPLLLLAALSIFFCWFFVGRHGIFGSKVDWISQHSVLPDYFRRQFYKTGGLFPEYAANIGGGQNIYHFSYYGLYSPVILVSYLFPSVKMGDYLMAASVTCLAMAVLLFYGWLRKRGFPVETSFWTAYMFLLSGPMIFHSYSQIMFVNYMPFLCMALLGVDRYFEKGKSGLYAVGVFLMIMTSFYFSIGGMLVLVLYGIYRYVQIKDEKITVKIFLLDGLRFCLPMLSAVLMSGILLLPTALALSGRGGAEEGNFSLASLLMPDIDAGSQIYTPYGIGLTALVIAVLLTGMAYRKYCERVLACGCVLILVIPFFSWALNGGLYIRDKALIPFLPLLCYLTADYFKKMAEKKIAFIAGLWPYIWTILILAIGKLPSNYAEYKMLILADAAVMMICYLLAVKKGNVRLLMVTPVLFLVLFGSVFHRQANRIESREFYEKVTDETVGKMIVETLASEPGFYRMEQIGDAQENAANLNRVWDMGQYISSLYSSTYNEEYQKFRKTIFQVEEPFRNDLMQSVSRNPVFLDLMSVRYFLSKQDVPGCRAVETAGGYTIYENPGAAPIAYVTDQLISEKEYEKLEFPYSQLAFSYGAIAGIREDAGLLTAAEEAVHSVEFVLPKKQTEHLQIKREGESYEIQAKRNATVSVEIQEPMKEGASERILFLQFQVLNNRPKEDVTIWLEGERNKLTSTEHVYYNGNTTFTYAVMMPKGQSFAELILGKGDYKLMGIQCFVGGWGERSGEERDRELYQSILELDKEKTQGNQIAGSVDVKNNGYFITSIPYSPDYEIRVDGKETNYEKVNTAFLGFPIVRGRHDIEIIYHAPGAKVGKYVSAVGLALLAVLLLTERNRRRACS